MFIDEPFGEDLCFAPNHGHEVPGHTAAGAVEWAARSGEFIRSRGEHAYVIGEVLDIWTSRHVDLGWYWYWSQRHSEAIRYMLPDALQAWVIDANEHEDEVGKAFSLGFLMALNANGLEGVLSDAPAFARRIKRLAGLRERTASFTVDGRMMHTTGLDVQAGAPVVANVYDAPGGLGIVVGETSRKAEKGGGRVRLELDLERYGRSGRQAIRVHHEDGSVRDVRAAGAAGALRVSVDLKKWECAVVEITPAGKAKKRSRGK